MKKIEEYITEYLKKDGLYSSSVFATSFDSAKELADKKNRGEKVVGKLDSRYEITI